MDTGLRRHDGLFEISEYPCGRKLIIVICLEIGNWNLKINPDIKKDARASVFGECSR